LPIKSIYQKRLNMKRRNFVKTASGLLLSGGALSQGVCAQDLYMPDESCAPTVRLTAGPYYTLDSMRRSDIREDRAGVPFRLTFMVKDDYHCTPIEGAVVDVWHSDANGLYSGVLNEFFDHQTLRVSGQQVDTRDRPSFLRGHQVSDSEGKAEFMTIYPGWYSGRLAHIHVRALFPGAQQWSAFVTQLFLPAEFDSYVYSEAPYRERGLNPMTLERDLVLRGDAQAQNKLTIQVDRTANGLHGQMVLAI
jgi:protocatechuate 3,4-dioxygenase beta subunit